MFFQKDKEIFPHSILNFIILIMVLIFLERQKKKLLNIDEQKIRSFEKVRI